ncbi:Traf2 and NCK-interacting protein kinase [Cricetulus griseus]|uniref:non-specific serine/threonine protein kinase n=1 Tax=Cricetulus griseus TaxID=10029 RepID=G3I0K9_CRIGR|nr:Traf2 and NCK-interacting protein kinase [Cricetulus griseus]
MVKFLDVLADETEYEYSGSEEEEEENDSGEPSSILNLPGESTLRRDFLRLQLANKERSEALRRQQLEQQQRENEEHKRQLLAERQKRIEEQKEQRRRLEEIPQLVAVKSQGPALTVSQSVHEQPTKGLSGFQEALNVTSHRVEMPRQNSDPTSENPPLPTRIEKFDRSSWLRQEEDIPPKVPQRTTSISPALARKNSPGNGSALGPRLGSQPIRASNPDLRRTEPVLESPLQRTSSGSSSSSSTPSSQPSSQGGSQPGSQAGSSERTRVRGVNLLVGTENGLMLLDRSGQGKVYNLINRRRFQQMDVLEGLNVLVTISGKKNKLRVYYLSWLRNRILHNDPEVEKKQGWITVGDLEGCIHYKVVKYERIKFLVIALKNAVEIYAWAPKPYHKFMAFKSFADLQHKPLLVDLTVEEGQRLKVIFGSHTGFHVIDVDSGNSYDIYIPSHIQGNITPHAIVILPKTDGMEMLVCYEDEGVYVNTYGRITKDVVLQWGEMPTSVAYIHSNQIMGWGEKAIEIRSVETGHLDGVFMHKRAQRLKFLCERNDKVFFASVRSGGSSQVFFMTLNRNSMMNW